jgi:probable phosphoglycerate mutase
LSTVEATRGTTIWLARHGEVHNPGHVLYGRLPRFRLTPEGQRQARSLADLLRARPLSAIYSSPMLRARSTASVILATHPDLGRVRVDSDLSEVRTGWQGEPLSALERIDWDLYSHRRHPEDDTLEAISLRMHRWLRRMLKRHAGQEVVGVSHGDPMLILVGTLSGLPLDARRIFPRPYIAPGVVYTLHFDASGAYAGVELRVPHGEVAA